MTTAIVAGQAVGSANGISGPTKVNPKADINAAGFPPPYWAYPANLPDYVAPPDNGEKMRVPSSNVTYTLTQIRDFFAPPDWHPEDHPAMPPIVGTGRKPQVWACGYCHLPTGWGKPENANVANLPEAYFLQTVADFKNGVAPQHGPRHPSALRHGRRRSCRRPTPKSAKRTTTSRRTN